jgi:hypothetical protein
MAEYGTRPLISGTLDNTMSHNRFTARMSLNSVQNMRSISIAQPAVQLFDMMKVVSLR